MVFLTNAKYGKDNVRLLKVKRDPENPKKQDVIELTVQVLLLGDIDVSYTKADNAPIVPTDTVKNTIYILAKQHEVWPIERFGCTLVEHFISRYSHIHGAEAKIIQHRWTRYDVQGKPHLHSFIQDGIETRITEVKKTETSNFEISSRIKDLTVFKSTGSKFYGYHQCEYTTLKETWDRILSTDVDATWFWNSSKFSNMAAVNDFADKKGFDNAYDLARNSTLEIFALEDSASVQATMYNISEKIIESVPWVDDVTYVLPNKHFLELDLSWHKGLQNKGKDAEVYVPASDPNGLIKSTVSRSKPKL